MFVQDELGFYGLPHRCSMPRRSPDPLSQAIGARIRQLREELNLTQEKLAYESEVRSKGYLSDIERGLALPSLETLQRIADRLGVLILDLVTFPDETPREKLTDRLRGLPPGTVRALLRQTDKTKRISGT